jgi:hypothetical protein
VQQQQVREQQEQQMQPALVAPAVTGVRALLLLLLLSCGCVFRGLRSSALLQYTGSCCHRQLMQDPAKLSIKMLLLLRTFTL